MQVAMHGRPDCASCRSKRYAQAELGSKTLPDNSLACSRRTGSLGAPEPIVIDARLSVVRGTMHTHIASCFRALLLLISCLLGIGTAGQEQRVNSEQSAPLVKVNFYGVLVLQIPGPSEA